MAENTENIPVVSNLVKSGKEQRRLDRAEAKAVYNENAQRNIENRLEYLIRETQIYDHFVSNNKSGQRGADKKKHAKSTQDKEPQAVMQFKSTPDYINNGEMRDYQVAGLNWMITIYENGISGILADEMGLGKTLQTIAFIGYLKYTKGLSNHLKYLVIAPKSTIQNWQDEFKRWCPTLRLVVLSGTLDERDKIKKKEIRPKKWDVLITSYEMVFIESHIIKSIRYHTVILDEGHRIKNEKTLTAKKVRKITTNNRMILTGTPIHNTVHELWALMNFLMPDIFNSGEDFDQWFQDMECINNTSVTDRLRAIIKPFMLRRIKADVEKSLKPKIQLNIYVGLSNLQMEWYKKVLLKEVYSMDSRGFLQKKTLDFLLIQLRKVTNHPYLFREAEEGPPYLTGEHLIENSGKMVVMDKLLARFKAEGSRVLIFSQMTMMLDIIEDYCQYRGHSYCRLDGSLQGPKRFEQIDEFKKSDSDKFLFLLSTRAGGLGINLANANIVIIYDSDFNPQMDLQAMDRAHRIGQTKQVQVFRLVAEKSVDERIMEYSEMKQTLDKKLISKNPGKLTSIFSNIVTMDMDTHLKGKAVRVANEDLDTILARSRERDRKEQSMKQDQLVLQHKCESLYKFDGEDFKEKQKEIRQKKKAEELDVPRWKRRRQANSKYVHILPDYLDYKPFWFCSSRLRKYIQEEKYSYMKDMKMPGEDYKEDMKIMGARSLTYSEREDYDKLKRMSFMNWSKKNFEDFIIASARFGQNNIKKISTNVPNIHPQEVVEYHAVFWQRYTELPDYLTILKQIEEGAQPKNRKRPLEDTDPTDPIEVSPSKKTAEDIPTIPVPPTS